MTPLMIAIVIAAAVGALVYVVASTSIEKADVRDSLRRLRVVCAESARHQVAFSLAGLAWVARTKVAEKAYSSSEAMPDHVLLLMLKEIDRKQEYERRERRRLSLW